MLSNSLKKVKEWTGENRKDLFIAGIIFFTGLSSFGLGRLSVDMAPLPPLSVTDTTGSAAAPKAYIPSALSGATDQRVVASRNGSTYYYSWCSGVKRIKDENKI